MPALAQAGSHALGTAVLLGDATDTHFSIIVTQGRQCQHHCHVAVLALE